MLLVHGEGAYSSRLLWLTPEYVAGQFPAALSLPGDRMHVKCTLDVLQQHLKQVLCPLGCEFPGNDRGLAMLTRAKG